MLAFMNCVGLESAYGVEYQPGPDKEEEKKKKKEASPPCETNKKRKADDGDKLSRPERMALRQIVGGSKLRPEETRLVLSAFAPPMPGIQKVRCGGRREMRLLLILTHHSLCLHTKLMSPPTHCH